MKCSTPPYYVDAAQVRTLANCYAYGLRGYSMQETMDQLMVDAHAWGGEEGEDWCFKTAFRIFEENVRSYNNVARIMEMEMWCAAHD